MAKKVSYSIPLRTLWKMYKKWCKENKSSDEMGFYRYARQLANMNPVELNRQNEYMSLNFWLKDIKKEILHIWLEQTELRDFLRDLPLKDFNGIKQYLKEEGDKQTSPFVEIDQNLEWVRYDLAVHVPNEIDGYMFSFTIMHDGTFSLLFCTGNSAGLIHESQYERIKNRTDDNAVKALGDFTFAVNLLAYMKCFPECVREGVPTDNNSNTYRYKDRSIQLGLSEKITETVKGAMRPHFRKGYFKRLSSEFYTKKRGEIIWVSETTVNAKSKTVEMSDDENKVQNFKTE